MWNEPKQERSRIRFNHILDTAANLFASHGYDSVTTNHIADHAHVAIGSLYQFFPNKEAVLAALVDRYMGEMRSVFPAEVDTSHPFEDYISRMIDNLALFDANHAAFRRIFASMEHGIEAQKRMHGLVLENVTRVIAAYFPQMSPGQLETSASTGIGIVKGLMILAEPPYALPVESMLRETKTALIAYIHAFLKRENLV